MRLAFQLVHLAPPQCEWAIFNLSRDLNKMEADICSASPYCRPIWASSLLPLDQDLHHQLLWFCSSSDWKYTTRFPGSSACRQQIMRLLSLHNHLNQFSSIFNVLFVLFLWITLIQFHCKSYILIKF